MRKRTASLEFAWLGLVAIPIFAVISAVSGYGPGVSSDGVFYISAANNLAAGKGLVDFSGKPLVDWPPLLPALLGILKWTTGLDTLLLALAVNLLSLAWIFWGAFQLSKEFRLQGSYWMPVLLIGICVSSSLIGLASNVGSDVLFIALSLSFLVWLMRYFRSQSRKELAVAAVFAAIACLLRYIGAALIMVGVAAVAIREWREWRKMLTDLVLFAVTSVLPAAAWTIGANYAATGTLVGRRNLATIFPLDNFAYSMNKIGHWFLPGAFTEQPLFVFTFITLAAALLLVTKRKDWRNLFRKLFGEEWIVLGLFILIYLAFVISTTFTLDHFESYDDRYQLPAQIPLLIFGFLILESVLLPRIGGYGRLGLAAVFLLWLGFHVSLSYRLVSASIDQGVSYYNTYNTKTLNESGFLIFLKSFDFEEGLALYSNEPEELYFFTGREVRSSLTQPADVYDLRFYLLTEIKSWPAQPRAYLIWFNKYLNRTYVRPHRLEIVSNLREISMDSDGILYWVTPK